SSNSILFTSSLNFQNNTSNSSVGGIQYIDNQNLLSKTSYDINSVSSGYNVSNNVLFRHAFPKKGRSISFGINTNFTDKNGKNYVTAQNTYYKGNSILMDSLRQLSDQQNNGDR